MSTATRSSNHRYEIILHWSDEDQTYIAEVPELEWCAADGATYQEAVANVEIVVGEWIETAIDKGWTVPEPKGRRLGFARPRSGCAGEQWMESTMDDPGFTKSSGNVFLDLGLPDAEELFAESTLALQIARILEEQGLDEHEAAVVMGVERGVVSDLLTCRLDHISLRELLGMLISLGQDVELVIEPTSHEWGRGGLFVTRRPEATHVDEERRRRYPATIRWSAEDESWIAEVRDLPGCLADGPTRAEAMRNLQAVIDGWIETAKELGRPIPRPGSSGPRANDNPEAEE